MCASRAGSGYCGSTRSIKNEFATFCGTCTAIGMCAGRYWFDLKNQFSIFINQKPTGFAAGAFGVIAGCQVHCWAGNGCWRREKFHSLAPQALQKLNPSTRSFLSRTIFPRPSMS